MSLDSTKVNISKEAKKADDLKVKKVGDDTILVYTNRDGEVVTEKLPGNLNRKELELLKKPFKEGKVKNKPANPGDAGGSTTGVKFTKKGEVKNKPANPGDAGGSTEKSIKIRKGKVKVDSKTGEIVKLAKGGFPDLSGDGKITQKDILMGKGVIKMKKGGIVKKKPSRTRIAKRGFGIAKRGY
jgi:hypothetical protein